ncbi:capsid protein [Gerygone associated gemycircularvirus 1]|uniref:Capsid protein n=1 Tax=Gerygone associated gemycircularvirus 1 TaxID=1985381 RepID=T1YSF7_9VIRU|nr:capsid protein [Gerygone associated gemycircularvirus 1]AGU67658.1 capsid protein [Gerygone associated gemycircularvirus 1]
MPRFARRSSRFRSRKTARSSQRTRRPARRSRRTPRRSRRRGMSTRSILNKTSRKKRNGMLTISNTQATGNPDAFAQQPLTLIGSNTGGSIGVVHFRPTCMDLASPTGVANSIVNQSQRTSSTCFMRGLAENLRIETSSGNPWFHRRVCITSRDDNFRLVATGDNTGPQAAIMASGGIETSNGWQRLAGNAQAGSELDRTIVVWLELLFKGRQGRDWDDIISAPVDTTRVDLKFDKTYIYRSGNESGILKEKKLWHRMNKNLYFDDDELGAGMESHDYSVTDKRGNGDYHIFDFFSQGSSGTTDDRLKVRFTSTLYWHEK